MTGINRLMIQYHELGDEISSMKYETAALLKEVQELKESVEKLRKQFEEGK